MKLSDVLRQKSPEVITIHQDKSIHDAIKVLVEHNIGALLVLDGKEKLVGIISERDILRESAERDHLLRKTKVKDVMTKDLIIGLQDDKIGYTLSVMTKNRIRHLPIMDAEEKDKIVGIISLGDAVKAQLDEQETDNRYLKQYMFGSVGGKIT
ncbi:CBS domain-containing protein [candidate division KSB1 bacterium]|nr:CBS domain-containing protein [candidate division KSB1 bacterium]NIR71192.1 CBS domain-containing protein [candidate division KSB1 bacterium]NIS26177.1 CBS domain-containing protein [candidate division KSB1 bacterium]NIT72942.1 CBS domain-containing protein [candidate division KSB1 bacterium]NIU26824.1 CBS domain-containing protein [candidate division KSB1 bacterium]